MSDVASYELSKELFELSGWKNTDYWWRLHKPNGLSKLYTFQEMDHDNFQFRGNSEPNRRFREENEFYPAYSLGYLLRKLPPNFNTGDARGSFEFFLKMTSREWVTGYNKPELGRWLYDNNHGVWETPCADGSPENATIKLCLQLIKSGIIPINKEG